MTDGAREMVLVAQGEAGPEAAKAFEKWAHANASKIHADAINEAAMGFAAGWEAAQSGVPALVEALEGMRCSDCSTLIGVSIALGRVDCTTCGEARAAIEEEGT